MQVQEVPRPFQHQLCSCSPEEVHASSGQRLRFLGRSQQQSGYAYPHLPVLETPLVALSTNGELREHFAFIFVPLVGSQKCLLTTPLKVKDKEEFATPYAETVENDAQ